MYDDMYEVIKSKYAQQQKDGTNSSKLQNYLLFAACYKLVSFENCVFDAAICLSLNINTEYE